MDELKFASWLPFEDYEPITLNKEDPLFIDLNDIVDNIKAKVLRNDVDPLEERRKQLESKDKIARSDTKPSLPTETDFEQNRDLRDINNTFKIIKILGQIVKNQKETMKKDDLNQLIEVSYNVCFRSIAFSTRWWMIAREILYPILQNKIRKKENWILKRLKIEFGNSYI